MYKLELSGDVKTHFFLFDSLGNHIEFNISPFRPWVSNKFSQSIVGIPDGAYWILRRCFKVEKITRIVIKNDEVCDRWEFTYTVNKELEIAVNEFVKDKSPTNSNKVVAAIQAYLKVDSDVLVSRDHHVDWLWTVYATAKTDEQFYELYFYAITPEVSLIQEAALESIDELNSGDRVYEEIW